MTLKKFIEYFQLRTLSSSLSIPLNAISQSLPQLSLSPLSPSPVAPTDLHLLTFLPPLVTMSQTPIPAGNPTPTANPKISPPRTRRLKIHRSPTASEVQLLPASSHIPSSVAGNIPRSPFPLGCRSKRSHTPSPPTIIPTMHYIPVSQPQTLAGILCEHTS